MQEVFEKIIEKLTNMGWVFADYYPDGTNISRVCKKSVPRDEVVEIVKQAAEQYNNGWIPCSEKLPEDRAAVLVQDFEEFYEIGICETKNGVKGFACGEWWSSANNYIAWQPLPAPYQPHQREASGYER